MVSNLDFINSYLFPKNHTIHEIGLVMTHQFDWLMESLGSPSDKVNNCNPFRSTIFNIRAVLFRLWFSIQLSHLIIRSCQFKRNPREGGSSLIMPLQGTITTMHHSIVWFCIISIYIIYPSCDTASPDILHKLLNSPNNMGTD